MPINGLTDKRRLPRIGKIKTGEKAISKGGKEYPRAIDYFRFDIDDEKLMEVAKKLYGDQPKVLDITFPFDDEAPFDNVFPQYYKRFRASMGCVCKGDGIKATEALEDGTFNDDKVCLGQECEEHKAKKCRQVASLKFAVAKFPALGIFQLDTGSYNSIVNINSTLALVKELPGHKINGVTFRLSLEPQDAKVEGKKKTIRVLHLMAVGKIETAPALPAAEAPALPAAEVQEPPAKKSPELFLISAAQQALIFTRATAHNIDKDKVRESMLKMFNKKDTAELTLDELDELFTWMEDYVEIRKKEQAK